MIKTDRFVLDILSDKYLDNVYNMLSDEEVTMYLNMNKHNDINDTKKLLLDYYNDKDKYPFVILDNDRFVGVFLIKLDLFDEDCFEFTIYIDKSYWNKGVYTEVLPYMTDYAFKEIGTGNFRGFVMENNLASRRVLEKCNFTLEKIFKVDGIEGNIYSYLITKEDYLK